MKKNWYKSEINDLTKDGKKARKLVLAICDVLSKNSNGKFTTEMNLYANYYEGYIIDSRKVKDADYGNWLDECLPEDKEELLNEDIGAMFFGGHFSRKKHKDAKSKAWVSLLEDCMGIGELKQSHTLTTHLKDFGPRLDFNCENIEELKLKLKEYENDCR